MSISPFQLENSGTNDLPSYCSRIMCLHTSTFKVVEKYKATILSNFRLLVHL